jgi:hypothetical protein
MGQYLRLVTNHLFLRQISSSEWACSSVGSLLATSSALESQAKQLSYKSLDLPYYSKFLLISAFLASFNPAKLDVRFFSKAKEENGHRLGRRKTGNQNTSTNGTKVTSFFMMFFFIGQFQKNGIFNFWES